MRVLLTGINAKFIHANLAIRLLQAAAERQGIPVTIREFTINQHLEMIFGELLEASPDVLGISCYIWNWEMVKKLVPELKKVLPHTTILLGGPEVSYESEKALKQTGADIILKGEGEESFPLVLKELSKPVPDLSKVPGIVFRKEGGTQETACAALPYMDDVPFVYTEEDMPSYQHRILYYETMRGCPFQCQYCLSSTTRGVRLRSLSKVLPELQFFLDHRVRQVKFVDRTFNCNKAHAAAIWRYLIEHDNGYTNFHFEIAADLLDDELIRLLSQARPGLFQMEIGVQSTNGETLDAIQRQSDFAKLSEIVRRLQQPGNIHLHLDLIAGLPFEDYDRFKQSFNDLYALHPDQLQLGFLKLLKGSGLYRDREQYGLVCRDYAPYEVLCTSWINPLEMHKLKQVEEMVELTYNSCRYQAELRFLLPAFSSPFAFFEKLAEFYYSQGCQELSQGKLGHYEILYRFFHTLAGLSTAENDICFQWLAKHDLYSHEKAKKLPDWLVQEKTAPLRPKILGFLEDPQNIIRYLPQYQGEDPKRILRLAHIEAYPFDPRTGDPSTSPVVLLYNYRNADLLGNAQVFPVSLE